MLQKVLKFKTLTACQVFKKCQYGHKQYRNLQEDEKERLVEY